MNAPILVADKSVENGQRVVKSISELAWEATWKLDLGNSGVVLKSAAFENILLTNSIARQDQIWKKIDMQSSPNEMVEHTCTIYRPFKYPTKDNPYIEPVRIANVLNSKESYEKIVREVPNSALDSLLVGDKLVISVGFQTVYLSSEERN